MEQTYQKSNRIFHANVNWLLSSDIQIKNGQNKGALYGWKNLNPVSFPFIYSEITGYAITSYCYIYSELGYPTALKAANESSEWILKNMRSYLLFARPPADTVPNVLSNILYSFDNGMIMIGLINLYKMTKDSTLLHSAEHMAKALIERFFDGEKLIARLDYKYSPIAPHDNNNRADAVKWSTVSGAYHSKLSMGLLELSRLTNNRSYADVSNSLCNYAIKLQKSGGQFITNPDSEIVYLHPHLYACEGLIYSGLSQSDDTHYCAALKGIKWATEHLGSEAAGGLSRNTRKDSDKQSDCTAQLLRLLILCRYKLEELFNIPEIDGIIEKLHSALLNFYIPDGEGRGAMKYLSNLDSACSWCTMFSMQALKLWTFRNSSNTAWMNYFI